MAGMLENKVVVISGVGPALGTTLARRCAEAGADLVLAARTAERLEEVASTVRGLGRKALCVTTDITDDGQVGNLVTKATGEYGHIDVLINNAFRVPSMKPLADTTFEHIREAIELTFTTEPLASASAGVKPCVRRSAPSTVSSIASRMCSKVVSASGFIDGTRHALLIRTSMWPYSPVACSTRLSTCPSSVVSVVTHSALRPNPRTVEATSSSRSAVRAASTRSAPASAQRRANVVPSAGPTPLITTTLFSSMPVICYPTILF